MMDITAQVIATGSMLALASLVVLGAFYLIIKYYDKTALKAQPQIVVAFILTVTLQIVLFSISFKGAVKGTQLGSSIVATVFLYIVTGFIAVVVSVMIGITTNYLTKERDGKQHTLTIMTNEGKALVYVDIATHGDGTVKNIATRNDKDASLTVMFDGEVVPAQYQEQPENLPA